MSDALQYRTFKVRAEPGGDGAKLRGILTSEQPVPMFDWRSGDYVPEVLLMSGMEARGESIVLLDAHRSDSTRDVVGSLRDLRKLDASDEVAWRHVDGELDISSAEADTATKVREGHIREMSAGYAVSGADTVFVEKGQSRDFDGHTVNGPANVRTKWRLQEASLVPIGADDQAKIRGFRSMADAVEQLRKASDGGGVTPGAGSTGDDNPGGGERAPQPENENRNTPPENAMSTTTTEAPQFSEADVRVKVEQEIASKHAKILEIGERIGDKDWALEQIRSNKSLDEVREAALDKAADRNKPVTSQPVRAESMNLTPRDLKRYDIGAALRDLCEGKRIDKDHSFVGEVSDYISERSDKPIKGIFVPSDFDIEGRSGWQDEQRDLLAGTATDGAELVPTDLRSDLFVPVLRPMPVMTQLGARVITGVVGNFDIPRETSSPVATSKAEAAAHSESESQFDTVSFTPHAYGFGMDISTRLIRQGSPSIVQLMRERMNREVAIKMDYDGINGAGSGSNAAEGIVNTTGVGTVTITSAGSPDFDEVLEFEQDVATANAESGSLAYVTTYAIRKFWKKTAEYGTDRGPIWTRDNEVNGYRAVASNQVATNGVIYGDWSQYMFAVWDGIEIVQTQDTAQARARLTSFTVNLDLDGHLPQAGAFSINA